MIKNNEIRKHFLLYAFLLFAITSCATKPSYQVDPENPSIPVAPAVVKDKEIMEMIGPYKLQLDKTMNEVIGYSEKELKKDKIESPLGNFTADAILKRSRMVSKNDIDLAAITIGGLRTTLPEGEILLKDIYELMPFENAVYILELSGEQTKTLFDYLAKNKNIAIANSMVILRGEEVEQVFINGKAFNENESYTLAISDYLAGGGDHMTFLKNAKVLEKLPLKVRDLLVEEVKDQHASGKKVYANVEGRIRLL